MAVSQYGHELFRHNTKPIYGLQFHPEVAAESQTGDELFDWVVKQLT